MEIECPKGPHQCVSIAKGGSINGINIEKEEPKGDLSNVYQYQKQGAEKGLHQCVSIAKRGCPKEDLIHVYQYLKGCTEGTSLIGINIKKGALKGDLSMCINIEKEVPKGDLMKVYQCLKGGPQRGPYQMCINP